ncbi:MAG: TrbC/VirB2 family protein [Geminicoccaceae bacterium]
MMTIKRLAVSVTLTALTIGQARAAQSGLPWEAPLQTLTDSLTGPVLQTFLIISIVVAGLMMALTEVGAGAKRLLQAVFGLSVAVAAVSFFPGFFGFAGAATF